MKRKACFHFTDLREKYTFQAKLMPLGRSVSVWPEVDHQTYKQLQESVILYFIPIYSVTTEHAYGDIDAVFCLF